MAGGAVWIKDGAARVCDGALLVSVDPCARVCGGGGTVDCCTLPGNPQYGPASSSRVSGSGATGVFETAVTFSINYDARVGSGSSIITEVGSFSFASQVIQYGCRSGGVVSVPTVVGQITKTTQGESPVTRNVYAHIGLNLTNYPTSHSIRVGLSANPYVVGNRYTNFSVGVGGAAASGLAANIPGSTILNDVVSSPLIFSLPLQSYRSNQTTNNGGLPVTWSVSYTQDIVSSSMTFADNNAFNYGLFPKPGYIHVDMTISSLPRWVSCAGSLIAQGVSPALVAASQSPDPRIAAAAEAQIRAMGIPCCGQ